MAPAVLITSDLIWTGIVAFVAAMGTLAYTQRHPKKEYIIREVPVQVQVEKPSAPMVYQPVADRMCSRIGPTYPPNEAPQQGFLPVPINPSYPGGTPCYGRQPGPAEQVGVLTGETDRGRQVLPLYAQRSMTNRNRFSYWTRTGEFQPIVIPVYYKGRDCMSADGFGCDIVYTGDHMHVPMMSDKHFVVSLYRNLY